MAIAGAYSISKLGRLHAGHVSGAFPHTLKTHPGPTAKGDITSRFGDIINPAFAVSGDITRPKCDITFLRDDITHDITSHDGDITRPSGDFIGDITLHEDDITSRRGDINAAVRTVLEDIVVDVSAYHRNDITFPDDAVELGPDEQLFSYMRRWGSRREFLENVPDVLYHGTSEFHMGGITGTGLQPMPPRVNWLCSKFGVYFTDSPKVAAYWAYSATRKANNIYDPQTYGRKYKPVILSVHRDDLNLKMLLPDDVDFQKQLDLCCVFYRYLEAVPWDLCTVMDDVEHVNQNPFDQTPRDP